MDIPGFLLRHQATVRTYSGQGATGPVYGTAAVVPCFIDDKRRLVRDATGREVVSETTLYCRLDQAAALPPGSLVTANGRDAVVITAARRDSGGLGAPDHLEVTLT